MGYAYQNANYGDYYQGDIFGSIFGGLKKVVGTVTGVASKVIPGPVGAVAGAVSRIASPSRSIPAPPPPQGVPAGYPGAVPVPGLGGFAQRALPGGASGYQAASCPVGYHYNKALARYERAVAQGKQVKQPYVVNACVAHRKMNPLNPKALRRSLRRQQGAVQLMRRCLKGSGYTISRRGLGKTTKRRR